ncbi:uncharacterized protein GGS25DRAFT_496279 [Hypoxylon fragiforme]|uniref:uncharacterized protein n=1 Tax=Hypoxylon fragiforme TaxID=63214 RepID=UPI0020C5FF09|nr:uncharacterized protein GGS25DRAFT_496279 [Hypoxylon fragiforme]KAI2607526.1 hypothetical protein GGS25DRAFT_496279 [Hypoxylon fragiforme]
MMATEPPMASRMMPGLNSSLTPADLNEIRTYEQIVNFRDTIASGKHPRIKVAKPTVPQNHTSLAAARVAPSSTQSQSHRSIPNLNTYQAGNMQSFQTNLQQPSVNVAATGSTAIPGVSTSRPLDFGKTNINPVLLDKPENSVKSQLQIKRQAIEQDLKNQFDQRKASAKGSLQTPEQILDLDLSDILAKAMTLTAVPTMAETPNISDTSDSFDNNTFYSSQHQTPDSRASPRNQNTVSAPLYPSHHTPVSLAQHAAHVLQQQQFAPQHLQQSTSSSQPGLLRGAQPVGAMGSSLQQKPNSNTLNASTRDNAVYPTTASREDAMVQSRQTRDVEAQVISSDSTASRSDKSGNADSDQPADHSRIQNYHQLLPSAHFSERQTPVIRAHDLLPLAPQPAHVSPLAVARRPPMPEPDVSILPHAPAQVTALRQEHRVVTSPESSPQGDKGSRKKGKKKNKRKAETRSDAPGSPYIKPEPRSPSPLSAPPFARPQKRLRSTTQQEQELMVYDEPQIERPISSLNREPYNVARRPTERPPYGFERVDDPYARQGRQSVAPTSQRLERAIYEERRPDGTAVQYIQRVQSPYAYATPYGAVEPRPLRAASYATNPQYREVPYQREGRMSVRPYADRARSRSPVLIERPSPVMAPPAPPRIIVDQYGREYIDPPRASTMARHSVVPASRPGERDLLYGRVPARAPSRMSGETYEEDGVIYRRASPTYAPRRVITQPEYGLDYRSYRERDYPAQPMGVPGQELIPIRGTAERRMPEEIPREYLPLGVSGRPAEGMPYYNRIQSVHPDVPPRQYAASVHPEVRRDAVPPVREFGMIPAEREELRREYSARPVEHYYDRPPLADGEAMYMERRRPVQQDIIYADNPQRPMYQ